ncbi:MAG: hypothetical protein IJM21_00955 [Clostridia bacterium]|nr:hypothetical protein [Clostridia bacterium]
MESLKNERMDKLMDAIAGLRTAEEAYAFMEDLCSIAELKAMEQRFTVARLLRKKMPYNLIINETGASTTTISRVNRSLLYGNGSYNRIFERLDDNP